MTQWVSEVVVAVEGRAGRLRLDRPNAIHALTTGMCEAMLAAILAWRTDPAVGIVLIDHLPAPDGDPKRSRGFCAGGDVRAVAAGGDAGAAARAFFGTEYRLNHALFTSPKPTVAFMDGVTMGGGVGLSAPCRFRVATERTLWAMPETAIGLFPDVGGGWYLSRLPGRMGQYLALTGARIGGAEALALGLATHFIPSDRLDEVKAALAVRPQEAEATLSAASGEPGEAALLAHREAIDRLFASDDLEATLAALEADGGEFAAQALATLRTRSPQAMKVSLRLLADGRYMPTFEDEMRQEYAVATRVVLRPDFAEGVRAVLVDRDNAPRWDPPTPEGVSDHAIDRIFAPLPEGEEWTPA